MSGVRPTADRHSGSAWKNPQYEPIQHLADGYQSNVWLAKEVATGLRVVLKVTSLNPMTPCETYLKLKNERMCLLSLKKEIESTESQSFYRYGKRCLRVPHIIEFFQESAETTYGNEPSKAASSSLRAYLVYRFIEGVPLSAVLAKTHLPEDFCAWIAANLALTLGALHERGFIYRDLKASNVIVDALGHVTLIDFGFVKYIGLRGRTKSICGTLHAMAPEIYACDALRREKSDVDLRRLSLKSEASGLGQTSLHRDHSLQTTGHLQSASTTQLMPLVKYPDSYGMEIDWWSFGILIYEMVFGVPPYGYCNQMTREFRQIIFQSPEFLDFPAEVVDQGSPLTDIITSLLEADPTKRLGTKFDAREVLAHPWLQSIDVDTAELGAPVASLPASLKHLIASAKESA